MHVKEYNKEILKLMYRSDYGEKEYYFFDIVKDCILQGITKDNVEAELLAQNKEIQLWNIIKKHQEIDLINGVVPLFTILSEQNRTVKWIGDCSQYGVRKQLFKKRPELYRLIDSLSDREYEILACVICEQLGADKIYLTAKGNEGGIDFFARIPFSKQAHFFFGIKGPIRIVGQCKKYSTKDKVGNMKEFIQTMEHVHNQSFRVGEVIPNWFKMEKGIIIGWHISDLGHQSGALDIAKSFGVLVSDTKQLIDILCKSDVLKNQDDICSVIRKEYLLEERYSLK